MERDKLIEQAREIIARRYGFSCYDDVRPAELLLIIHNDAEAFYDAGMLSEPGELARLRREIEALCDEMMPSYGGNHAPERRVVVSVESLHRILGTSTEGGKP